MLRRAFEIALAAKRTVVLSCGLLQVDAKPGTVCNMYGPNILHNTRPVGVSLDPLTDFEFRHGGWLRLGAVGVLTCSFKLCCGELQGDASELPEHGAGNHR